MAYALSEYLCKKAGINSEFTSYLAGAAALSGANAPDWLEIASRNKEGERRSVIPHRTITHWLPLWILGLWWGTANAGDTVGSFVIGFTIGGLMHLAMDWPNPLGITVWVPWKRVSGHLWRSGQREILLVLATWGLGWAAFKWVSLYQV